MVTLPVHSGKRKAAGYGLAMLMVFLATTVMIGASMQMMVAPITMAYLGASSQDNLAARQLAEAGMDVVQADLQTKFDTGVAITTAYSYPLTPMSMPNSPDALAGATSVVGSYSGSVASVNGNMVLAKVTATVGVGTYTYSKLIALTRSIYPLDNVPGATVAYGMRLLRSAHLSSITPYAIRVRRASDNAEQDIGFDSTGGLDVAALRNFLDNSSSFPKPLDSVGSATAAYSLRKLRTAYTGSAIRVRRSTDNAEQDIGFTASGDLDVNTLVDFVGTSSGYVTTWYDQSGNSRNQSQASTGSQPAIVNSGVLVTVNGRPSILFDGTNDYFSGSFDISNNFSILTVGRSNVTHELDSKATSGTSGSSGQKYLIWPISSRTPDSEAGISLGTNGAAVYEHSGGYMPTLSTAPLSIGSNLLITTSVYVSKQPFLYLNSQLADVGYTSPKPNVYAGKQIGGCGACYGYHSGEASEVIYYPSSLSTANRQTVENNQARYYQLTMSDLGFAKPLDTVTGAAAAYGLRKLRTAYAGNAIQVRRSSDNTTSDIGFDTKGNLNIATLMNFCGTSSCYVTTWYDQSGSNNATQATTSKQPRIVNAGVLETRNGRPAVRFDSSTNSLALGTPVAIPSAYTAFGVAQKAVAGEDFLVMGGSSQNYQLLRLNNLNQFHVYAQPGPFATHDLYTTTTFDFTTNMTAFATTRAADSSFTADFNGTYGHVLMNSGGGTTTNTNATEFGRIGGFYTFELSNGWLTEAILYTSTLTQAQREVVRNNEMAYYNFNSAMPGTGFITKWYDQSGNGYDLSQPTTLLQPRIQWDNVTNRPAIAFNGTSTFLTSPSTLNITSSQLTGFAVANLFDSVNAAARIFSGRNNSTTDHNTAVAAVFMYYNKGLNKMASYRNGSSLANTDFSLNKTFQATMMFDGANNTFRMNGIAGTSAASSGAFSINQIWVGASPHLPYVDYWSGTISEMILYPSNPSTTNMQNIERGQREFYSTP